MKTILKTVTMAASMASPCWSTTVYLVSIRGDHDYHYHWSPGVLAWLAMRSGPTHEVRRTSCSHTEWGPQVQKESIVDCYENMMSQFSIYYSSICVTKLAEDLQYIFFFWILTYFHFQVPPLMWWIPAWSVMRRVAVCLQLVGMKTPPVRDKDNHLDVIILNVIPLV